METLQLIADGVYKRADNFISDKIGKSRSHIASLIDDRHILLNGQPLRKSTSIKMGDVIDITFAPDPIPDITPKEVPFDVVYDSERYAVINKPAGIAVHPAPGHYNDSLINGLLYKFNIDDADTDCRPGIVHRLDKDTSGLMLIAKDRDAREILSKLFQDRAIEKYYLAIASGVAKFRNKTIEAPIARDKKHRQRMSIEPSGRYAKTGITVIDIYDKAFMVDIRLYTGRTHQIRVHMKHIGHPLLGDELYGGAAMASLFHRQALHSYKMHFTDPFIGEDVTYTAELPDDMKGLVERIRKID